MNCVCSCKAQVRRASTAHSLEFSSTSVFADCVLRTNNIDRNENSTRTTLSDCSSFTQQRDRSLSRFLAIFFTRLILSHTLLASFTLTVSASCGSYLSTELNQCVFVCTIKVNYNNQRLLLLFFLLDSLLMAFVPLMSSG